ncbi:hypothetical protein ACS0TY_034847 [Phlomoides rotata]
MDCNKDEAVRAKEIAETKMANNDFEGARKIALKAQKLYPEIDNITQMLSTCDVLCSAQKRLLGSEKDWYEILQLERFADEVTVKKQYRRLALILHPDKNRFPGADGAFKLIHEANALLSDPAKKSSYDKKIRVSTKPTPVNPPNHQINRSSQFHQQYGAQNNFSNGFGIMNQDQATSIPSARQGVFWTCCPFCKVRCQYRRQYINKNLQCSKCTKAFIAQEISVQGDSSGSKLGQQGPRHVPPKPGPSQPVGFQEKVVPETANFKMGVQNAQGPLASRTVPPEPGLQTGCRSKGVKVKSASGNMKTEETKNGNTSSFHGGKKGMASDSDAMYRESRDVGSKTKNRGKRRVVQSSDSSDIDIEDLTTQHNLGNPGHCVRRSSRKRHNDVIYEETDEDDHARPFKREQATKEDKGKELKGSAHSDKEGKMRGVTGGKRGAGVDTVVTEIDSERDVSSSEKTDTKKYNCPDPEFSDFDKLRDESQFDVDQFWACYDDVDNMPRFYAKVKKVCTCPFKLLITWLEAKPIDPTYEEWIDEALPVGCGSFRLGKTEETDVHLSFSHQMYCEKGKKRGSLIIYPREGEVWALFKDWDKSWSSDPEHHRDFKYEIVEVLSDFVEDVGIKVCYLDKVTGFVSLFQRPTQHNFSSFLIEPNELYRFSHRVPCSKMIGNERKGVPIGSFELDSASLPLNLDDLYYPSKADTNMDSGVYSSLPKNAEEKGKSILSEEGFNTPKKFVDLKEIKGEMPVLRRSPRGAYISRKNGN